MLVHGIPRFRAVLRAVLKRLADNDAQCLDELRFIFAQCRSVICAFTMLEIKILSFFFMCLPTLPPQSILEELSRQHFSQDSGAVSSERGQSRCIDYIERPSGCGTH